MIDDEMHFCWSSCCDLGPHVCICGNDCEPDEGGAILAECSEGSE